MNGPSRPRHAARRMDLTATGTPTPVEPFAGSPDAVHLRIFRGIPGAPGAEIDYRVPAVTGMVVLDAIHYIQHHLDTDLACRWNCKAAKCGSCGAEVNGRPVLLCKTRVDALPPGPITVGPMQAFPLIKDLVCDVSAMYELNRTIRPFSAEDGDGGDATEPWRIAPGDIGRLYEFRRCIECFLCQDVCHVLRDHDAGERFLGPRYFVRVAALEMHPRDLGDRIEQTRTSGGLGYCNVTRCCTEVCPEHINITDDVIIPLKERAADRHWDPLRLIGRRLRKRGLGRRPHLPTAPP
ncbi:MAG: succinate dehydrogenase/fumarate reductase iron-sulfur subunit [Candidatus Dormibacteria bacterium]